MKKIFLLIPAILLSAGCSLSGSSVVAGTVKTVNGGADWQFMNKIENSKATLDGFSVSKMSFDPNDRTKVYAGAYNGGLYQWSDASSTWSELLSNILVYDFVVSPADSKTIYAAGLFDSHGRVVVTKDGGATWNQIYNEGTQDNPVRAIVLNPYNVNQIIIGLGSGSVIKSQDGGLSWQLDKEFNDRINRMLWQGNNLYVLTNTLGLYISTDGGMTFNLISTGVVGQNGNANYGSGGLTFNQFYVDSLTSQLIYLTTSQGLFKSTDGGATWTNTPLPLDNGSSVSRAIAVAQTSSNIVFTNVASTVYKSTDGGVSWQTQNIATTGIINYILIDPQLPQIAWAGIYGGQ